MASKNEKICHLLSFIVMLVYFRIVSTTNIDCAGKPFHCVNSTHFMICVDVGSGISKTVDDFTIQCPSPTVCRGINYFECEYQAPTTTASIIRQSEENIKLETIPHTTTRSSGYVNTVSVAAQSDIATDTHVKTPSATSDLILTTTEPTITPSNTNPVHTSEPLESLKISKDSKIPILPFFTKSKKSIEANTTSNITNERNIVHNKAINADEALNKNETLYLKSTEILLHNETVKETSTNPLTNSRDDPYNNNTPTKNTLPDLITLTTTDYLNNGNNTFKQTTSKAIRDFSSNGTAKFLQKGLISMNTTLTEDFNLTGVDNYDSSITRMKNETSTTVLNLIEQITETSFSSDYATESRILWPQGNIIPKDTTSKLLFNNSFSITNENTTVTPLTNIPSFSTLKSRVQSIADTVTTETTGHSTLLYSSMKDNNFKLLLDEVKPKTPLRDTLTITTAQATHNTIKTSSVAPSISIKVMKTHLLQDQTGSETSLLDDFQFLDIVKELPLLDNSNLTQTSEFTTFSSPISYETTKELITENIREPMPSYKFTESKSYTNSYILTNTEKPILNKIIPIVSEFTTMKSTIVSSKPEDKTIKNEHIQKANSVDEFNTMLHLEDPPVLNKLEGKTLSSTGNFVIKINTSISEPYLDNKNPPFDHIISVEIKKKPEKPYLSIKDQTTTEMSSPTDVYELLRDEMNVNKKNTTLLYKENYVVEPTRITEIPKLRKNAETIITETTLAIKNITNANLLSQDQMAKEQSFKESSSTSSLTTISYITNQNITADFFFSENIKPASPTAVSSSTQINNAHMEDINTPTKKIKINELLPIQDQDTRKEIVMNELYSSSTEMPNTFVSLPEHNNLMNVTNVFTTVPDTLSTFSSINEKGIFLSLNVTSVKVDNNRGNFTIDNTISKLDANNINITGNNSIPSLNDTVKDQYTTTKYMSFSQQPQPTNIEMLNRSKSDGGIIFTNNEILSNKDINRSTVYPGKERLVIEPKVTDIYNINNKSNVVIEIIPTVQTSDSVLLPKIDKINNEELKHVQISDGKQITQVVLQTTGVTFHSSNIEDVPYISNRTVHTQVESLKTVSVESNKNPTINPLGAPENAKKILENNNNNNINKKNVVKDDAVGNKVSEDIAADSVFTSRIRTESDILTTMNQRVVTESVVNISQVTYPSDSMSTQQLFQETIANSNLVSPTPNSTDESKVSGSSKIVTINPQTKYLNTEKITENNNSFQNIVGVVISDSARTQSATETMAHSVMSSSTPASTDNVEVWINNKITTMNPQTVAESRDKIFENQNKFQNKVDLVSTDIGSTPPTTIAYSVLSSSTPAFTDNVEVSANDKMSTLKAQTVAESTEKIFGNKVDSVIIDTANIQPAEPIVAHSIFSSPTATSRHKDLATNNASTINSKMATTIGNNVLYRNRSFENNEDMIASDIVNIELGKEIVGNSFLGPLTQTSRDESKVSTTNEFPTISPQMVTESTKTTFKTQNNINNIENKENVVINDTIGTNDIKAHSGLSLSTLASTDQNKTTANKKMYTINPQTVAGNTKAFGKKNNYENNVDVVTNIEGIKPAQETTARSIPSSLDSTNNFEVSANKIMTTRSLPIVASNTEKIFKYNNNFENIVDAMATDTTSTQPAQETMVHSVLSSSTPTTTRPATANKVEVYISNKINTTNPPLKTGNAPQYNHNNIGHNMNISDAMNTFANEPVDPSIPISTDEIKFSASNIDKLINPHVSTESTQKIISTNKLHSTRDTVYIKPTKETITHSDISSSTTASTDAIKVSPSNIIASTNPHIMTENTRKIISTNNNSNTKSESDISDLSHTQLDTETVGYFVMESSTQASTDDIKVSTRKKLTTLNIQNVARSTENIIENNNVNTNLENKVDMVVSDTVKTHFTKETVDQSMGGSVSTDQTKVVTTNPQTKYLKSEKNIENYNSCQNTVGLVISDRVSTQPATETMAHTLMSSSTPASTDNVEVWSNNKIYTMNPQTVAGNRDKIFENKNNFENKVELVTDKVSTPPTTIAYSVLSSSTPVFTDNVEVSANDKMSTVNPQAVVGSTEKTFENNNFDFVNIDTVNIQPAEPIVAHSVVSSPTATSMNKVSVTNKANTTNPQAAIGNTVQYKKRGFENNENMIASDMVNIQLGKEIVGNSFLVPLTQASRDKSKVSTNIKFPTINPLTVTESTKTTLENQNKVNDIENKENVVVSDIINTKETKAHSGLSSSTLASTNKNNTSADKKFTTMNPQTVAGNTEKIFRKKNNYENKVDIVSDRGGIKPAQETTARSVPSSLDSTDNFKVSANKITTTMSLPIIAGDTEKIFKYNNNFDNIVDAMITDTISQPTQEAIVHSSVLSSSTPATAHNVEVSISNKISTIDPPLEIGSASQYNNNNGNNINISDVMNTSSANELADPPKPTSTDQIKFSASNIIKIINPHVLTESTQKIISTDKLESTRDTVYMKPKETITHSDISSSTSASTDAIKISPTNIIANTNPLIITESTRKVISTNNSSNTKSKADFRDLSGNQVNTETVGYFVMESSTQASTNDIKVSTRNNLTTLNVQNLARSTENIIENNNINRNLENKVDVVTSDTVNIHFTKETTEQSIRGYFTPALTNDVQVSSTMNKMTTKMSQIENGFTEKIFKNNDNNNIKNQEDIQINTDNGNIRSAKDTTVHFLLGSTTPVSSHKFKVSISDKFINTNKYNSNSLKKYVDGLINDTVNTQIATETKAHLGLGISRTVSMDEIKFSASNIFTSITPRMVTNGSTGNILQYSNKTFENKVDMFSDAVNIPPAVGTVASVLSTSMSAATDETNVLDSYTLTTIKPQFATTTMEKILENNNNIVKVPTVVHTLLGSNSLTITLEEAKNNESTVSNRSSSFSAKTQTPELAANNIDIKVVNGLLPNIMPKHNINNISYTNPNTKVTTSVPVLLQKNRLNNPLLLKTNETFSTNDSDINNKETINVGNITYHADNIVVPSKLNTNKRLEELLNQTTLPQLNVAEKRLQNKSQNITIVTKEDKITVNKHLFTCQNRFRGRYADENDCRKFYICIGKEQPLLGECPVNTVFSEIKKQCTNNLSHCIRQNQFRCIQNGKFGDALKNNVYYICVKNKNYYVRLQFQCQAGYHFNKNSIKCVRDEQTSSTSIHNKSNKASDQRTVENKSKEKKLINVEKTMCMKEGKFPDPQDGRKYYICVKNNNTYVRFQFQCQSGHHLSKNIVKCVREQKASSISVENDSNKASGQSLAENKSKENKRTKNANKNMCTEEGKFPDPHDCRKYYVCSKNSKSKFRRKTKKCDSDEVFHPDKEKCVDNDSYECD